MQGISSFATPNTREEDNHLLFSAWPKPFIDNLAFLEFWQGSWYVMFCTKNKSFEEIANPVNEFHEQVINSPRKSPSVHCISLQASNVSPSILAQPSAFYSFVRKSILLPSWHPITLHSVARCLCVSCKHRLWWWIKHSWRLGLFPDIGLG